MRSRAASGRGLVFGLGVMLIMAGGAVACGGGGGGGGESGSADVAKVAAGEKTFRQVCATCHGQDANGVPNLGKGLRGSEFVADRSDAEVVKFLAEGRAASHPENTTGVDMPPRGGNPALTDEDLEAVVAYLRTL